MKSFVLTPAAVEDLREIASWLAEQAGEAVAERVENGLFASFQRLADTPGLGHRRSDLTKRPLVFFTINPTSSSISATFRRSSFMRFSTALAT